MKKLLSILAVSSLVVSTPLTVVACKKEDKIERVDYNGVINDFVAETALIFQSHIYEAFKDYNWMSDKDLPPTLSMDEIRENVEDLSDPTSRFYKKVSNEIYKVIPTAEINKYLVDNVTSNINYSPIIIDKATPLKNGISIEKLEGEVNDKNFKLFIEISTDIFYLDSTGLRESQNVSTYVTINILEVPNALEAAKTINKRFENILYGEQANEYIFHSDTGNLENTAVRLEKEGVIDKDITGLISDIDLKTGIEQSLKPKIIVNNLKTKVDQGTILDASRFVTADNRWLNSYDDQLENYRTTLMAMAGSRAYEEVYFGEVNADEFENSALYTDWNVGREDPYTEALAKAVNQDPTISKAINQYNLDYNFSNSALKKALSSYDSLFQLDMKEDKRTIALFGANVSGVGFELEGQYYDFPKGMVCYRQETEFESTRDLYEAFMKQAFYYQKTLFNIEGKYVPDNIGSLLNFEFELKIPKIAAFTSNKEQNSTDEIMDQILTYNSKANFFTEELDLTSRWTLDGTHSRPDKYLYSTRNKNLHLYTSSFTKINNYRLDTYFFSSGVKYQNKVKFYFPNYGGLKESLSSDQTKREERLRAIWSQFKGID